MGKGGLINRLDDIKNQFPSLQSSALPHSASPGFQAKAGNYRNTFCSVFFFFFFYLTHERKESGNRN